MNTSTNEFHTTCVDEPRSDMLRHGDGTGRPVANAACNMETYHGGLRCCPHKTLLTDLEQDDLIPNVTDTYFLKWRCVCACVRACVYWTYTPTYTRAYLHRPECLLSVASLLSRDSAIRWFGMMPVCVCVCVCVCVLARNKLTFACCCCLVALL